MRIRRFLLPFVLSAPFLLPSVAQQAASSNAQAVQLLQSAFSALSGALPSSLVASGTITRLKGTDAASCPVRVRARATDKFRWEADLPGGTVATVINGNRAQSQSASDTKPLMAWQVGGRKAENFPVFLLARWLQMEGMQAHFLGQESIDGQALYHISVVDISQKISANNPWRRDKNRGEYELYIDPVTSLPVRLRYYQDTSDTYFFSLAPVDVVYSDFRAAGRSVFPFNVTRYTGKEILTVLQLQSVNPNGPVTDQDFAMR